MKPLLAGGVVISSVLLASGSALAKSAQQCDYEATQYANTYYNTNSTVAAAALGAAVGVSVSAITHSDLWAGAFSGTLAGLVLDLIAQQQRKQKLHNIYYHYCMNPQQPPAYSPPQQPPVHSPPPQPVYDIGPPPPGYGQHWWMQACSDKYTSFRWSGPHKGQFKGYDYLWHWCHLN